jgi:hypothetical protein
MFQGEHLHGEILKGNIMKKLLCILILIFSTVSFADTKDTIDTKEIKLSFNESIKNDTKLSFNGSIRNDAAAMIHSSDTMSNLNTSRFSIADILETKLIAQAKTKDWKFYADGRFFLNYSSIANQYPKLEDAKLMRAIMRVFSEAGDFTIGKTYINFGTKGLFNPFEFDKTISTTDLTYDKSGLIALEYVLNVDDVFQLKAYGGMEQNDVAIPAQYKGGMSLQRTVLSFDFGAVANRMGTDRSVFGAYFKGDIEIGINGSYAFHANDAFNTFFHEITAGIDYSFLSGKLITTLSFYYNSAGAGNTSEYNRLPASQDSYFSAKYYLYGNITGKIDEFTSVALDIFANMVDFSVLVAPTASFIIVNGLTLTVGVYVPIGWGNKEFSFDYMGYTTFLVRLEGKF